MKIKYVLLIITALLRFLIFLFRSHIIYTFLKADYLIDKCEVQLTETSYQNFFAVLIEALLMDFLSIIIILRIFYISDELVRQRASRNNKIIS